jgi:hypothetical protein
MEKERIEGILGEVNRSHAAVTSESIKEMNWLNRLGGSYGEEEEEEEEEKLVGMLQ